MTQSSTINRRKFLAGALAAGGMAGCGIGICSGEDAAGEAEPRKPIPVILGTDIGDDIDDSWALGFLLRCPELDLKLVVGEYGRAAYRGKLIGKFLQAAGRADVPIGLGMDADPRGDGPVAEWARDYDLGSYPGKVHRDGVQAIIDTINESREMVTVISIAPSPNLAAALARSPKIAERAKLVGMYGSLRKGYEGSDTVSAEWNVKADVKACQAVFAAPWSKTITPLDTCGVVKLDGERYRKVRDANGRVARTVIENYRVWCKANGHPEAAEDHSSTLFDTVAVYLAFARDFCRMEDVRIQIDDNGITKIDPAGNPVSAATAWKDLDGFRGLLARRLG